MTRKKEEKQFNIIPNKVPCLHLLLSVEISEMYYFIGLNINDPEIVVR